MCEMNDLRGGTEMQTVLSTYLNFGRFHNYIMSDWFQKSSRKSNYIHINKL